MEFVSCWKRGLAASERPRRTAGSFQSDDPCVYYFLSWASPPVFTKWFIFERTSSKSKIQYEDLCATHWQHYQKNLRSEYHSGMHNHYNNTRNQKWGILVENFSKYRQINATAILAIDLYSRARFLGKSWAVGRRIKREMCYPFKSSISCQTEAWHKRRCRRVQRKSARFIKSSHRAIGRSFLNIEDKT